MPVSRLAPYVITASAIEQKEGGIWIGAGVFCIFFVELVYFNEPSGGVCISPSKEGGFVFHGSTTQADPQPRTQTTNAHHDRGTKAKTGGYRRVSTTTQQEQHQAPMQAQVLAQDGGGANEAAGGCATRNGRARFERGVRGVL